MTDEWNRYMGPYVTPKEYAEEGGDEESIKRDLKQMWGNSIRGDDYMNPDNIDLVAQRLARLLP